MFNLTTLNLNGETHVKPNLHYVRLTSYVECKRCVNTNVPKVSKMSESNMLLLLLPQLAKPLKNA
jgi:hypothetical protein